LPAAGGPGGDKVTSQRRALLLGGATVLCWSTMATAFKLTLAILEPAQLLFVATTASATVLLVIIGVRGELATFITLTMRHWRMTILAASLNPVCYYLVLFEAYDRLPAQLAQPLNYTWSIVLSVLSVVMLGQRLRVIDWSVAAVCYIGVLIMIRPWEGSGAPDRVGVALALGSTVLWALYWIVNIRDARPPLFALAGNFAIAAPVTALVCYGVSGWPAVSPGLGGALYIGCFEMGVAFLAWSHALRIARNTSRVSHLVFLSPPISLVLVHHVLGEALHTATFVGLGLILVAVIGQQHVAQTAGVEK
jgi:drug/metabolite transporter (DMT)-like permease